MNEIQETERPGSERPGSERPVVLEVKNIAKRFGGITALTDFNLTVRQGDIHCLIGPNGAGKTTVLKIIMGCNLIT